MWWMLLAKKKNNVEVAVTLSGNNLDFLERESMEYARNRCDVKFQSWQS